MKIKFSVFGLVWKFLGFALTLGIFNFCVCLLLSNSRIIGCRFLVPHKLHSSTCKQNLVCMCLVHKSTLLMSLYYLVVKFSPQLFNFPKIKTSCTQAGLNLRCCASWIMIDTTIPLFTTKLLFFGDTFWNLLGNYYLEFPPWKYNHIQPSFMFTVHVWIKVQAT